MLPCTPLVENFLYSRRVRYYSNGIFDFNFLALLLSEILGWSQIYTRGPYAPLDAPWRRNFCTQSEYFTISNCVFNLNILALVVSERDFRGSQIYVRGPCAPCTLPSGNYFVPEASTLLCLMAFLISTFYFFLLSDILGGPKFTLGGRAPPGRPLAEKFLYRKRVFHNI